MLEVDHKAIPNGWGGLAGTIRTQKCAAQQHRSEHIEFCGVQQGLGVIGMRLRKYGPLMP
jgi:hypothetical protein